MHRIKLVGVLSLVAALLFLGWGCQEDSLGPRGNENDTGESADVRQDAQVDSGPEVEQNCGNDVDDDDDGLTDCSDTDCLGAQGCGRIIFGIADVTTGAMGGGTDAFEYADELCRDGASNVPGLEPEVGWTSILGNTDTPAADRVGDEGGAVYNLQDTAVVGEDGNLFDADEPLQARILRRDGRPFQDGSYVWTGTMPDGSAPEARYTSSTCVEWADAASNLSGYAGHAASRTQWLSAETGTRTQICTSRLGLYCISARQQ